jgi:uncharacterized protein (TIGR03067 family)
MLQRGLLVLVVFALLGGETKKSELKGDLKKLQGVWKATSVVYNGETLSEDDEGKIKLTIKGDVGSIEAKKSIKGEYGKIKLSLDESTTPRCMDVSVQVGGQKGITLEAIYKLDGDKLTICTKVLGMDRPAKFASPGGESVALIVLERVKN